MAPIAGEGGGGSHHTPQCHRRHSQHTESEAASKGHPGRVMERRPYNWLALGGTAGVECGHVFVCGLDLWTGHCAAA